MSRMMVLAIASMAMGASGCGLMGDPWAGAEGKKRVIVTIAPLESFVHAIGGDLVAVKCLCTKTGPHHYEADAADLSAFRNADIFISVGLGLDNKFAGDLHALSRRKNDLPFIKLGHELPRGMLLKMAPSPGHEGHDHGEYDPHLWLGVPEATRMVEIIASHLSTLDSDNAATYKKNAESYAAMLKKEIQEHAVAKFKDKTTKRIITFHDSFAYFARSTGLEVFDTIEKTPGDSPDAPYLTRLAKKVQEAKKEGKPVGCITEEPQYDSQKGSTKALKDNLKQKGVDLELVTVDPLETADPVKLAKEGGDWYITRMKKNIDAIAGALP